MVDELLELGRPYFAEPTQIRVDEFLEDARNACSSLAARLGVTMALESSSTRTLLGDREGLGRAVRSVLENAIEHSPVGGTVWLRSRDEKGYTSIVVEDSGPGFPPQDLPFVFTPFFGRRQAGVGLGLAIARRVVRQHGGEASAANRPNGGAVVQLSVPAN